MAKKVKEVELQFNNNLSLKLPLKFFCSFNLSEITSSIYCLNHEKMVEVLNAKLFSFVLFKETESGLYKGTFNRIKGGKDIIAIKLIYSDDTSKQIYVPTRFDKKRKTNLFFECKTLKDGSLAVCICRNAKQEIERFTSVFCTEEYIESKREDTDFDTGKELA